jgi:putative sterol carrier protein
MPIFADTAMCEKIIQELNKNSQFSAQTEAFDGSIQLEIGDCMLWLKIYKGAVIDFAAEPSIFGYTFKITGSEKSWEYLFTGARRWADLTFPGKRDFSDDPELSRLGEMSSEISIQGNLLEAGRLTEAVFELAYTVRKVVNNQRSAK